MAKEHPTTPSHFIPSSGLSPNVSGEAGQYAGVSRRNVMQLMSSAAAVPALALASPAFAHSFGVQTREWSQAVSALKRAKAEYDRINQQHTEVFDAAEAACPRRGEYFSRYNLGCYGSPAKGHDRNVRAAHFSIVNERTSAKGGLLTEEEARDAFVEANRVVDEFDDWYKRRDDAHRLHDCDAWEKRFETAHGRRHKATEAVLMTRAPDHKAVLFKLHLLSDLMEGEQDQERVIAIRDDVRRLLAS